MQDPHTNTRALAHLSRLALQEGQIARFASQLDQVFEYVSQMHNAPSKNASLGAISQPLVQDLVRLDTDPLAITRQSLFEAVPTKAGNLIKVRAVL